MGITAESNANIKQFFFAHWPLVCIVVVWCIFSAPTVLHGLAPFPSRYLVTTFAPWSTSYGMPVKSGSMPDVITQIYPWKHISIQSWKQWSPPLWNPYSFAGTLHAGNYQTAVFSPVNIVFFFFSQPVAWSIVILMQPLLAAFFMYLYLRSERLSLNASFIGSVAFMFCGFMVVWMAYGTLGYAVLVLPLCLYAVNMLYTRKAWWALPLLSASVAFSLVSGHFQISLYVLLFTVLYILCHPSDPGKRHEKIVALVCVCLGMLLVAPQLWETVHAYSESVRSASFAKGEVIPWQYLITLFAPDFYGHPVTRNDWFGHYAEWAGFIGVVPLILSFMAIQYSKHRKKLFFSAGACLSLLFATPTPLMEMLYAVHIPVLSTSSASRIIVLFSFSLCVLAAMGTDTLSSIWRVRSMRNVWFVPACAGVFITIFWTVLIGFHPLPADKLAIAVRNSLLPTALLVGGVTAIIAGGYVSQKYSAFLRTFIMLLCVFDVLRFASKWMPFEPFDYIYPAMPVIQKISSLPNITTARVIGNIGNEFTGMYGISGLEGYDAVYKKRYGELVSAVSRGTIGELSRSVVLMDKHGKFTEKFVQLTGVGYYMHKVSDGRYPWAYPFWEYPHYQAIWADETYEIIRNTNAFPRAYLVSSFQTITDASRIIDTLFSDTFDRRESVILEEIPAIQPQQGPGEAVITSYTPQHVVFQVQSQVPKLLFLSDVYDAGWRAYVNGEKSAIYRADYAFRAIGIPAGTSTVHMKYEPVSMRVGGYISLVALLGIIGLSLRSKNYAHRIL